MSKVTVKHYINGEVKPVNELYPVYIRITYNQKHNFIKSFTDIYLAKETTIEYLKIKIEDIQNKPASKKKNTLFALTREKIEIERAIEILVENENYIYERKGIKQYLEKMFRPLEDVLIKAAWEQTINDLDQKDENYYHFYTLFEKSKSLNEVIGTLDSVLYQYAKNKGIAKYFSHSVGTELFNKDQLDLWGRTQMVLNTLLFDSEPLLIDWYLFNFRDIALKEYKDIPTSEIERTITLIDTLIRSQSRR